MSRRRWIVIAVVLAVAMAGVWWWKSRAAAAPKYRTAEVDRGSIESVVSATGTIRPVVQVQVGSQVSGTVEKVYADYNSRVRAGQVLLQLERSSFRAREVQAEAAVARADASVRDGERTLGRARELFARQVIAQAELDAQVVALDLRKADLKQARAQLQSARVDMQHTTIRSPIDGVVIARSIDQGQTVAASLQAPQLFVIANDLAQMQVETKIDEADIGQLRQGLPVSFTVDAFPDREFEGRVTQVRLEPIVESNVVTYTTVINTGNPDGQLRPGMTANVTVKIERRDDVLRVPNAALRFRPPNPGGERGGATAAGMSGGGGGGRGGTRGGGEALAATPGERGALGQRSGSGGSGRRRGRGADSTTLERGEAAGGTRGLRETSEPGSPAPVYRPGVVYLLVGGKPERVMVRTGITDGAFTEVRSDKLQAGNRVIIGMEAGPRSANLQPPPGMGGPQFRGGGGGRR